MTKQLKLEMFMMGKRAEERADRFMEWQGSKRKGFIEFCLKGVKRETVVKNEELLIIHNNL